MIAALAFCAWVGSPAWAESNGTTVKIGSITEGPKATYVTIDASTDSFRATPLPVTFNLTWGRRYIADAAVLQTKPEGLPPELRAKNTILLSMPGISGGDKSGFVGLVGPDLAIGPPPESMATELPTWDRLPFRVDPGKPRELIKYFNVDHNCLSGDYSVDVQVPPSHGKIAISDTEFGAPKTVAREFSADRRGTRDSRSTCSLSKYTAKLASYEPALNYTGTDTATLVIRDHNYISVEYISLYVGDY